MRLRIANLLVALCAVFVPAVAAQEANDTYLPRSRAAEEALSRGDLAWGRRTAEEGALRRALEAWHEALVSSAPGDSVRLDLSEIPDEPAPNPWLDPAHEAERRSEAVELAVRRRLVQAGADVQRAWRERFEELATQAAASLDAADWARNERDHPGTLGAFRSALRLAERQLEEGRRGAAETWLARADAHLALGAGTDALRAAVQTRRDALARAFRASTKAPHPGDVLRGGQGLELRHFLPLNFRPGGRPGLARLADGQLLIQGRGFDNGRDLVWEVDDSGIGRPFEPWKLLEEEGLLYPEDGRAPGKQWNYSPLADGESAIFVLGRAEVLGGIDERSNAVIRIHPPSGLEPGKLEWGLGPSGLWNARDGLVGTLEAVLGAGLWEFQPEPLLTGDRLIVQARQWKQEADEHGRLRLSARGEARAWAFALDRRTGALLWKRELGRGAEPRHGGGMPSAATRRARTPAAPPIAVAGGRVFCATQLGLGALLDRADGRLLWSYLNPRRSAEESGWSALPAPRAVPGPAHGPETIVWAPADGDRLLWLRGAADLAGEGLQVHPPLSRDEAEALLGADRDEVLILTRFGPNFTLAAYRPATGERLDAIDLGQQEKPLADLLWSEDRALFASDRALYLFDRERDLYLLEAFPLPPIKDASTGRLLSHGGMVQLLLPSGVWTLAVQH